MCSLWRDYETTEASEGADQTSTERLDVRIVPSPMTFPQLIVFVAGHQQNSKQLRLPHQQRTTPIPRISLR